MLDTTHVNDVSCTYCSCFLCVQFCLIGDVGLAPASRDERSILPVFGSANHQLTASAAPMAVATVDVSAGTDSHKKSEHLSMTFQNGQLTTVNGPLKSVIQIGELMDTRPGKAEETLGTLFKHCLYVSPLLQCT